MTILKRIWWVLFVNLTRVALRLGWIGCVGLDGVFPASH